MSQGSVVRWKMQWKYTLSNWPRRYRLGGKFWVPRCIMKHRGASAISYTDHGTLSLKLKHPRWKYVPSLRITSSSVAKTQSPSVVIQFYDFCSPRWGKPNPPPRWKSNLLSSSLGGKNLKRIKWPRWKSNVKCSSKTRRGSTRNFRATDFIWDTFNLYHNLIVKKLAQMM